jgi:hypothetical protein
VKSRKKDRKKENISGCRLVLQDMATNETREAETQQVGSHGFVVFAFGALSPKRRLPGQEFGEEQGEQASRV